MSNTRIATRLLCLTLLASVCGCDAFSYSTIFDPDDHEAGLPTPDGIDPRTPNVERTTTTLDFAGIRTIRVDLPTARVVVAQSDSAATASLRVTEMITVSGLSAEVLRDRLTNSFVTAERSFVDDTRLDLEATLDPGLSPTDLVFDLRLVIPAGANLEIYLGNGPVDITDVTGNIEVRTANGAVSLHRITGNVAAFTSNRPIDAAEVTGNVRAETSAADVSLRLTPPPGGRVSAVTAQGRVALRIAQTTAATLNLAASGGTITATLNGFSVSGVAVGEGFLSAVLNGGGGQIEASATAGEISFEGF